MIYVGDQREIWIYSVKIACRTVRAQAAGGLRPRPTQGRDVTHPMSSIIRNHILLALSRADLDLLQPHLAPVSLQVRDVLVEPNKPIEHVYFIEQGISSVVAINPGDQRVEVSNIGREGMVGVPIIQHVDRTPHITFVQVAGSALRVSSDVLQRAMEASPTLRHLLLRYAYTSMLQTAHTALANGRYSVEQRLARWLVMSHDRVDSDDVALTHEFLALMLGVRRPGVTGALHVLEGNRMIKASRGQITVLDRQRLIQAAGGSYGVPEEEYTRLIRSGTAPRQG